MVQPMVPSAMCKHFLSDSSTESFCESCSVQLASYIFIHSGTIPQSRGWLGLACKTTLSRVKSEVALILQAVPCSDLSKILRGVCTTNPESRLDWWGLVIKPNFHYSLRITVRWPILLSLQICDIQHGGSSSLSRPFRTSWEPTRCHLSLIGQDGKLLMSTASVHLYL